MRARRDQYFRALMHQRTVHLALSSPLNISFYELQKRRYEDTYLHNLEKRSIDQFNVN